MYFFDSTEDDERYYQAADFARFHAQIIGNGVSNTANLPDLEVTARTNMEVALGAGYMFANGYMYENESTMTLRHDIADPTNDRIDRVIICFDNNPAERRIYAYIKKGIPAVNPVPPVLTRDNYVFEMSVSQVRIIAGKSFIEQPEITDERTNDNVCGYIPLHNIYRGLNVNEFGMVTMPNQSFIKTGNSEMLIPANTPLSGALPIQLGNIEEDKQGEVFNDTQIRVKADGVYHFWVELGFPNNALSANDEIHIYLFVNGNQSFPLGTKLFSDPRDNYVVVSGMDSLKEGDVVDFRVATYQFSSDVTTNLIRVRSAKLS